MPKRYFFAVMLKLGLLTSLFIVPFFISPVFARLPEENIAFLERYCSSTDQRPYDDPNKVYCCQEPGETECHSPVDFVASHCHSGYCQVGDDRYRVGENGDLSGSVQLNDITVQEFRETAEGYAAARNPSLGGAQLTNLHDTGTTFFDVAATYTGFFLVYGKPEVDANGNVTGYKGGAVESMGTTLATFYGEPPATTQRFVADVLQDAHIVPKAYAQGLGFAALNPILETWKMFRNLAYLFFVLIFLIIGFLIMFRRKVGQTAVTAQQAIPRVIVALIAVTFSYAIAGFLIDVMYLFMYLLVGLFGSETDLIRKNIFQIGAGLIAGATDSAYEAVSTFTSAIFEDAIGTTPANLLGGVTGLGFAVVVGISLLIGIFRLFYELLKTYISIILSITLSPLLLMMEAIPGKSTFMKWIQSLIANLAAFPALLMILIIYHKITDSGVEDGGFIAPYLIGTGSGQAINTLLGLGMLLIMTDLIGQVKKALGAGGGIFEQFATNFGDAIKRGYTGGELIPGLSFTNTDRFGLSGRSLFTGRPLFGTAESRKRAAADKEKPFGQGSWSVMPRGLAGHTVEYIRRKIDVDQEHKDEAKFEVPEVEGTTTPKSRSMRGRVIK